MERVPKSHYTKEFREEAVNCVTRDGLSLSEVSKRLSLPPSTLEYWVKAWKSGKLKEVGSNRRELSEMELELHKLRRELAKVKMERDFLKKAAAYFAKEPQ